MATYLETVKAASKAAEAKRIMAMQEKQRQEIQEWQERLTPLVERLQALLDRIPNEIKAQGLSLVELRKMLRGRHRGNVHPGELGAALRALKYSRVRRWVQRAGANGFAAVWRSEHYG